MVPGFYRPLAARPAARRALAAFLSCMSCTGAALLAAPAPAELAGEAPLGLRECLLRAADRHAGVRASRARAEATEGSLQSRRADRTPDLELLDQELYTDRSFPALFNIPTRMNSAQARLHQRVYQGGALRARVEAAHKEREVARFEHAARTDEALRLVAFAYLQVLQERAQQAVLEESLRTRRRRLRDVRAKVEAGVLLETDRLQGELEVLEEERALLVSRIRERNERVKLHAWLGFAAGRPLDLSGGVAPLPSMDAEALLVASEEGGAPRVEARQAGVARARAAAEAAHGAELPQVELELRRHRAISGLTFQSRDRDWSEGEARLRYTLLDGGRRRGDRNRARAERERAGHELDQERTETDIARGEVRLELREARQRLTASIAELALARRNLEIVQERYLQGLAVQAEILDADVAFRQARLDEVVARFDILRAMIRLLELGGELQDAVLASRPADLR